VAGAGAGGDELRLDNEERVLDLVRDLQDEERLILSLRKGLWINRSK
jgi:hypothetical protein